MINPALILDSWDQVSSEVKHLVSVFASPAGAGRRYVLGRNEHSIALSKVIDIDCFVDDFAESGMVWNNKPVVRGETVPQNAIIVNCSMSISPISAHDRIEQLGVAGVIAYADLCKMFPDRFVLPGFVLETRDDIRLNQARWEALSQCLADDQSRRVLDDLLSFRLTGDYRFMRSYRVRFRDQYFEDFLKLESGEVFVDAGGFNGDTTDEFCRRVPNYGKVLFFEPSPENIAGARTRLSSYRSIELIQRGLSDTAGILGFNPDAGSASSINELGSYQIDVTTLDQYADDKVTFIKMDLEGWELKALAGSTRHIQTDHPKLAITVYHHSSDFWRVFELVIGLRRDYDVFLRHYSEGWSETVMYFVPR